MSISRRSVWIAATILVMIATTHAWAGSGTGRQVISLDRDWRFVKGDPVDAQSPRFDALAWRTVDVPHDWSIEGPFGARNPTTGAGAFLPAGVGWYRKTFTLPAGDTDRRVSVELDGVMANSDIWINGFHLGRRPSGYVSQRYDLTGQVHFGSDKPNLLAVRADNSQQPASRWYAGAGIYRHVRLVITGPVHLAPDATVITTPQVGTDRADVQVRTTVTNETATAHPVTLQLRLLGPNGTVDAAAATPSQTVPPGKSIVITRRLTILHPERWDIERPTLYRAVVQVRSGAVTRDEITVPFGIRKAHFDAATGFHLNDRNLKIKGVCLHQDGGAFGVAVPTAVWEQRLRTLKEIGVNAIRTAHGPPAPEFLDLCDRLGFLVMDELFNAWTVGKEPYDYHLYFRDWSKIDVRDTVLRDRNHPCIILYSAGNEIRDTPNAPLAKEILASLVATFHQYDPTRTVTQALFRPNSSHDYENGLAELLDVVGQNYRENELAAAHRQKPERKIIGTENLHDRRAWLAVRDNPAFSGQFLWTGIDYLGESRRWPFVGANSGLMDRTGKLRPLGFERQSWWSDRPMVYIARRTARPTLTPTDPGFEAAGQDVLRRPTVLFADWTPKDTAPHEENIEVYSNCAQVELFLNGKSLGIQPLPTDAMPRVWKVPFAPGTLRAVGSNPGKPDVTQELKTAGNPARIALTAENEGGMRLVRAAVVDTDGIPVPGASDSITFKITGQGHLAAVDNGDMTAHFSFQSDTCSAFDGTCLASVQTTAGKGILTVTATAPGLTAGSITLSAKETR